MNWTKYDEVLDRVVSTCLAVLLIVLASLGVFLLGLVIIKSL